MKTPKKIVFYCGSLSKGGAERVFVNLAEYFKKKQYQVYLVTPVMKDNEYQLSPDIPRIISDITEEELSKNRIKNFIKRYRKLRKIFKNLRPDLVFSCNGKNNFMAQTASWGLHYKVIVSVVATPTVEYPTKIMQICAKILFRFVDGVVFQTQQAMDFFPLKVRKKGIILPNSLTSEFIRCRFEGERKKEIVAVGRLDDNKNYAMLIRAFKQIYDDFPEYTIKIYGEGEKRRELEELIHSLGMDQSIFLQGQVNDIADKIYASMLFVMTSDTEGMPNALMEAMALGLCVISTDCPCGGPKSLISNGENGYLIPVRNENALAAQLRNCLSNPDVMQQVGKKAIQIQDFLNPDVVNAKWEKYFENVLNS